MTQGAAFWLLTAVWAGCAVLGGAPLALLARRMHPGLSFRRLWIFYTALLGFTMAAVLAIAMR